MILAISEITIANIDDVNIATEQPVDPVPDQLWLDTGTVPNILKRWAWIEDEEGWGWINASPTSPEDIGAETPSGAQQKADDAASAAEQAAKDYAEERAAEAQAAAEAVAYSESERQAAEALATAEEIAQGYIGEETQARLDQAEANLEEAKTYAAGQAEAAEAAAKAYAEEQAQAVENRASKYMTFDPATGLRLGAQGSPSQIVIDNRALQFLDLGGAAEGFTPNPDAVAYLHGQKFYVSNIEAVNSLLVGNHLIEKLDGNITLVRWVG